MTRATDSVRWTIEDLDLLSANEWIRYEIIDGELFVSRSPHRLHQQICVKIARVLDAWSENSGKGETIFSPGIIFSEADNVVPDLVWVSSERLAKIEDESGHLNGAPELIIEVLSSGSENKRRDKQAKLKLYSDRGVIEYWIVDRFVKQVEIYRRARAKLVLVATLLENNVIDSPILPGFSCSLSRFFP